MPAARLMSPLSLALSALLLPTPAGATGCNDVSREDYLAMFNLANEQVLDILGDVTQQGGACEVRLLATDGVHEIRFEWATVQGKDYFHKLSERLIPDPREHRTQ
jgi:hypothetical protein